MGVALIAVCHQLTGYIRANWDEDLHVGKISFLQPTPAYYECGISIP